MCLSEGRRSDKQDQSNHSQYSNKDSVHSFLSAQRRVTMMRIHLTMLVHLPPLGVAVEGETRTKEFLAMY